MVSIRLQQLVLVALSLFARHESVVAFVATPHPTNHHHHWTLRDTAADANGATTDAAAATTTTKMSAVELSSQTGTTAIFTSEDIDRILPHRYPFALVDRVVSYEAGKSAIGIKSVTKVRVLFSFILFASWIGWLIDWLIDWLIECTLFVFTNATRFIILLRTMPNDFFLFLSSSRSHFQSFRTKNSSMATFPTDPSCRGYYKSRHWHN